MSQDAFQSFLTEASVALADFRSIDTPARAVRFFRQLGYDFSGSVFGDALPALGNNVSELVNAVQDLGAAGSDEEIAAAVVDLIARIVLTIESIHQLHSQIQAGGGGGVPNIDELPRRLTDFLILNYLHKQRTEVHEILYLLGLIEHDTSPAAGQSTRVINWDRFGQLLTDPGQIADDVYQWSTDFDATEFLTRLERVMRAVPLPGGIYPQADTTRTLLGNTATDLQELRFPIFQKGFTADTYSQFGITFSPVEAQGADKKGIGLLPYIMGAAEFQFDVCSRGVLVFESSADIKGIGLVVRPPFNIDGILNLTGGFKAAIEIKEIESRAEETILIGSAGGTRLSIQGLGIKWFIQNPQQILDIGFEGQIQALRLVISGDEGDGFLQQVLSSLNVEAEASLALGMSLLNGFTFSGGAKLALEIGTHIDLGPLQIQSLRLALGPTDENIEIEAGATLSLNLGPLQAVVENIGVASELQFQQGNLGPVNLDIGFKPPNGVGLSIDAGVVTGGGYLYFDFDREEYAGILELDLSGIVSVTAVGLITTRMPDGSKGFSLLLIITAEFGSPIQLGFGFTLSGVGGLLGLNRTMRLEQIATGIRNGGINSIMFPDNVIENAPRIISDLKNYFPVEEGTFLIGPMVMIGWGTPNLVTVSLGVIIEIPGNIAILGVLKVALPDEDAALIIIQVNFMGAIEFDKKRLWFFASLYESRVLFITLEGEMGLLVAWGDDANFVVSVGGFHPAFNPPALPFGEIRRIAISILNASFARIRVEGYFAVTSNSVQFGARVEVFFGVDAFNIDGHLAFDALFRFSPFYFIISISASLSVKVFGIGLFSVKMRGSLEGPSPWHVEGEGSISLLFFDIGVDFSHTWGQEEETTLPPIEVMPLLFDEFQKLENWQAALPAQNQLSVSLRSFEQGAVDLILHPVGSLKVSQRAVPLEITIDKVGNQKPSDANRFSLSATTAGIEQQDEIDESFASGQYFSKSDSQLLNAKAFEPMQGGVELSVSGESYRAPKVVKRVVRYEKIIIDTLFRRFIVNFYGWLGSLFGLFLNGNAMSLFAQSYKRQKQLKPFEEQIVVNQHSYAVVKTEDNSAFKEDAVSFNSYAKAREYLKQQVAEDANLANELNVIPSVEMKEAA
jgi:hypothetical protein